MVENDGSIEIKHIKRALKNAEKIRKGQLIGRPVDEFLRNINELTHNEFLKKLSE